VGQHLFCREMQVTTDGTAIYQFPPSQEVASNAAEHIMLHSWISGPRQRAGLKTQLMMNQSPNAGISVVTWF